MIRKVVWICPGGSGYASRWHARWPSRSVRVLDEPTAALDPISRAASMKSTDVCGTGKTTFFISHRLGSAALADEILVIDDGRVAERGTHSALMAQNGLYAKMYESQRSWYQ